MSRNIALNSVSNKVGRKKKGMNDGVVDNNEGNKSDFFNLIIKMILYILIYGILIFGIVTLANKGYEFAYQIYGDVSVEKEATLSREIEVVAGDNALSVASKLYDEGLIVDKYSFIIRMKLSGEVIQPNKYTISNDMNYKEIIDEITMIEEKEE